MTEQPTEVLHFDAPEADDTPATDPQFAPVKFTLAEDPYVFLARRPKTAILVHLAARSDSKDPMVLAQLAEAFIDAVLDKDGREHIRKRFQDPDDTWDYELLVPVIDTLKERWFRRPTGSSSGSAKKRRRAGPTSAAASRSAG